MMKKDYQQALAFFGRSEVGLRTVPAWLGEVKSFEGACLEEQGKFPAAAVAYKQALDAAPGNLMARTGYGRLSESLPDTNAEQHRAAAATAAGRCGAPCAGGQFGRARPGRSAAVHGTARSV